MPDWKAAANLVRKIAENYKLPYYTLSPTYSVCKNHGYIAGEVFTCPDCGEKTEVYSRITGYYRPVQNWNDGKSQEYKDRAVYNIGNSVCKREGASAAPIEEAAPVAAPAAEDGVMLFTTATCPNCKIACALLDKAGVAYNKLLANEHAELATAYGIKQAPTLVVVKNGEVTKFAGVSEIKKFLA
jgi:ribonucleoside-triphosphate reductase